MNKVSLTLLFVLLLGPTTVLADATSAEGRNVFEGQIAPILEGMGSHQFSISSKKKRTGLFFNQAIALAYGFNHLEAGRSFRQVAPLDSKSAMADQKSGLRRYWLCLK